MIHADKLCIDCVHVRFNRRTMVAPRCAAPQAPRLDYITTGQDKDRVLCSIMRSPILNRHCTPRGDWFEPKPKTEARLSMLGRVLRFFGLEVQ